MAGSVAGNVRAFGNTGNDADGSAHARITTFFATAPQQEHFGEATFLEGRIGRGILENCPPPQNTGF